MRLLTDGVTAAGALFAREREDRQESLRSEDRGGADREATGPRIHRCRRIVPWLNRPSQKS